MGVFPQLSFRGFRYAVLLLLAVVTTMALFRVLLRCT
nr:MAG TPA: hypothetical protein [Caudoviricetes sp.]